MPITYVIDESSGVVLTTASGVLTDQELLEHKRKLTSDSKFRPGMVELSDIRAITKLAVTNAGIAQFVSQDASDKAALEGHKLAIVVSDDLAFGMARMYEMMTSMNIPGVRIFRDINEARSWLGLPDLEGV